MSYDEIRRLTDLTHRDSADQINSVRTLCFDMLVTG
jgi:hypothetical protein